MIHQRKEIDDYARRMREVLRSELTPEDRPMMGRLLDNIYEALREICQAAVAGSAAEEEMSRAQDLGSETGMAAAVLREESAVEMMGSAHQMTLGAIRELLLAFRYVGPLDTMFELPRPPWTSDMSLIGTIGLLSSNIHAAITSQRLLESGSSVWQDVARSASRLKDVIATFPQAVHPTLNAASIDGVEGRILKAWLGLYQLGQPVGGRWGFGPTAEPLRLLDQNVLAEVLKLRSEVDAALRSVSEENIIEIVRLASRFQKTVDQIDLASSVDFDGDSSGTINGSERREDQRLLLADLANQARQALYELDAARSAIDSSCVLLVTTSANSRSQSASESLLSSVNISVVSLSTLLALGRDRDVIAKSGAVYSQTGSSSPRPLAVQHQPSLPQSITSSQSLVSRRSDAESRRQRVRGLDEEFLDQEEERDRALAMQPVSASTSQTSLTRPALTSQTSLPGRGKGEMSPTSSSTSLAYQQTESDSGSNKGNRSSFMRFMRGRSNSDTDDGECCVCRTTLEC